MRLVSVICLFMLVAAIAMPTHAGILFRPCDDETVLVTLDVCHSGPPAVSDSSEMPSLCGCPSEPVAPGFCCFAERMTDDFSPPMVIYEKDRPPRA
jgi:hypothetical protein